MEKRLQAGLRSVAAAAIVAGSACIPLLIDAAPVDAATHASVTAGRHSIIIRVDDPRGSDPAAGSPSGGGGDSSTDAPGAGDSPSDEPTDTASDSPTDDPTDPSASPEPQASDEGNAAPDSASDSATDRPTDGPSDSALDSASDSASDMPTDEPTDMPTDEPTDEPTNDAQSGSSSPDNQTLDQSSGSSSEPSGEEIAAAGAQAIADGGLFGGGEGSSTQIALGVVIGAPAAGAPVDIEVEGFTPGSTVTITVRSTPVVIGTAVVPDSGAVSVHAVMPSDLGPGVHEVIVTDEGGTGLGAMVLLSLDDQGNVTAIAPQGDIASESTDPALLARSLDLGKPLYSSLAHPATVAAIAVTGAAIAGVVGAAGGASAAGATARGGTAARSSTAVHSSGGEGHSSGGEGHAGGEGNGEHGGREAKGHGHVFELEGIEVVDLEIDKAGDRSRTWRTPLAHEYQLVLVRVYEATSRYSVILPRTLSDGMWARAMFGSGALLLWIAGIAVGVASLVQSGFSAVPASFVIILAIIVLGVLDAFAGFLAWATISLGALVTLHIRTMDDFLTIIGVGLLAMSLSFFAHHLRPIRRHIHSGLGPVFDRCADYAISPVIVAFTAVGLSEGLNGLSGLELISHEQLLTVELVTGAAVVVRMIFEDLALHHYPQRCKAVSFPRHHKPTRPWRVAAITCRTFITFLVFGAFIGYGGFALGAALLLAVPLLMDVFKSKVPRIRGLHQFLPEGIAELTATAVIGVVVTSYFFKWGPAANLLPGLLVLAFVPSALFTILHGISAPGEARLGMWPRRMLGVPVYLFIVGLFSGLIVLVH